jgi:copper transport protein
MVKVKQTKSAFAIRMAHAVAAILIVAIMPIFALAHAKLARSQPKAKETLSQPPKLIELWFTEELEPGLNTIEVKDQQGKRVDRGQVTLAEGNKKAQVEIAELTSGVYTVVWKSLSADEHVIRGRFTFTVATPTAQASPTPGTPQLQATSTPRPDMSPDEDQGEQIATGQVLVRWLTYLAMMTLFGGFAFRLSVLEPSLRRALDANERVKALGVSERRALTVSWIGIALLAVTSVAALVLQASGVFDTSLTQSLSPSILIRVVATGYGASWILQVISLGAIGIILLLMTLKVKRQSASEHSVLWWAGLVAGAALLVAPSWTGHAAASAKDFPFAVFADWLHLLAGGFWVGGLFHLALTFPPVLSVVSKSQRVIAVYHLIRRFTRIAIPSVVLLVLAGLYNTWAHIPNLSSFWITPYGMTLSLKLAFVGVMLLLGGINNFHFGNQVAHLLKAQKAASAAELAKFERGFRRSVAFEAALGVIVLLVTAVLVFLTPARSHPVPSSNETELRVSSERR